VAIDPAGELIAAGGWTRGVAGEEKIYLFERATGRMVQRLEGLPTVVNHLTFSPDGRYLAAVLGGQGLRVFERAADRDRADGWAEIARDEAYGDDSYGAAFAPDGRLATTSLDGQVRLYDAAFALIRTARPEGGDYPFGLAFSPDGQRLAVGFEDSTAVALLDGRDLAALPGPDVDGIDNGSLSQVACSRDGRVLHAAGRYDQGGLSPVVSWSEGGLGARRAWPASKDTVMSLLPLADGGLLVAAQDPYLARLDAEGGTIWQHDQPQADYRRQDDRLAVSADGLVVDFGYRLWGEAPARVDLRALALTAEPPDDDRTRVPVQ
jgi:hypothetical protein